LERQLHSANIRCFDLGQFAEPLCDALRDHALTLACAAGVEVEFIQRRNFRKEDRIAEILVIFLRKRGQFNPISATGYDGGLEGVAFAGVLRWRKAKVATTSGWTQFDFGVLMRGGVCGGRVRFNPASSNATSRSGSVRRTSNRCGRDGASFTGFKLNPCSRD
jgi:hypothetical protein